MYILYMDESGSTAADGRHLVLGGLAIFERGLFHRIEEVDRCVAGFRLGVDPQEIELHGSPMYGGRGIWRRTPSRAAREDMIHRALGTLQHKASVRLFATIVDRQAAGPRDPMEIAFEIICEKFNMYIGRMNNKHKSNQRGLIVMDESTYERPLQALARNFGHRGGRWGSLRYLAEVPLFVDSTASRMVQLADLIAWATFRRYEHRDGRFFDPIIPLFDAEGDRIHGLVHYRDRAEPCYCPACMSRSVAS